MNDKYDISKSFKLSSRNVQKIDYLVQEKSFKSDSDAIRFCLDLVVNLSKKGLLTKTVHELIEDME